MNQLAFISQTCSVILGFSTILMTFKLFLLYPTLRSPILVLTGLLVVTLLSYLTKTLQGQLNTFEISVLAHILFWLIAACILYLAGILLFLPPTGEGWEAALYLTVLLPSTVILQVVTLVVIRYYKRHRPD